MIVGLEGGMCNQLFQVAFGYSVSRARAEEIFFTKWRFENDPSRDYALDPFTCEIKIVSEDVPPIIREPFFRYNPEVYTMPVVTFTGHWQSEKYFDKPLVRSLFRLKNPPSDESRSVALDILRQPSCFVHFRRTDNLLPEKMAYHGMPSMGYYHRAIDHIRLQVPNVKFFLFSDEPEWCKATFPALTTVGHNPMSLKGRPGREHEDIWLMSLCRHAIIANSTFSWWGAYLGPDTSGIVIAPKTWFGPASPMESCDIVPERWLKFE